MSTPALSIVIPAYNEAERIAPTLERVLAWAAVNAPDAEVLVVDDGSSDATIEVAASVSPKVRVVQNGVNRGKGYSVRHGVLESRGDLVLFSDADLSTPIEEYAKLREAIDAGADVAIGSRGLAESNITESQPYYRVAMGRTFNRIVRRLAVRDIMDTQCGFKLFKGPVARELFAAATIEGFAFDVEILFLALRRGFEVAEIPVTWANDDRSRVHAVFDSMRMLRDIAIIRARHSRWVPRRFA